MYDLLYKLYYLYCFFFEQIATSKDGLREERVSIVSQEQFQKIKPGSQNGGQSAQVGKQKLPAAPPVIQVEIIIVTDL